MEETVTELLMKIEETAKRKGI
ncbi:hypothetical protein A2U01_0048269, partial [Trifolium medium]|nr:hypothetical protein [Trifolium medium]